MKSLAANKVFFSQALMVFEKLAEYVVFGYKTEVWPL